MRNDKEKPSASLAPGAGKVSNLANASWIAGFFGLMGFVAAAPPFVLLMGVIAIICGHIARNRIRKYPQPTKGSGIALAGLIFGYICVSAALLGNYDRERTLNRAKTIVTLATATALESAINNFFIQYGKLPDVETRVITSSPQGVELLNILLGLEEKSESPQNIRQIKFLHRDSRHR